MQGWEAGREGWGGGCPCAGGGADAEDGCPVTSTIAGLVIGGQALTYSPAASLTFSPSSTGPAPTPMLHMCHRVASGLGRKLPGSDKDVVSYFTL